VTPHDVGTTTMRRQDASLVGVIQHLILQRAVLPGGEARGRVVRSCRRRDRGAAERPREGAARTGAEAAGVCSPSPPPSSHHRQIHPHCPPPPLLKVATSAELEAQQAACVKIQVTCNILGSPSRDPTLSAATNDLGTRPAAPPDVPSIRSQALERGRAGRATAAQRGRRRQSATQIQARYRGRLGRLRAEQEEARDKAEAIADQRYLLDSPISSVAGDEEDEVAAATAAATAAAAEAARLAAQLHSAEEDHRRGELDASIAEWVEAAMAGSHFSEQVPSAVYDPCLLDPNQGAGTRARRACRVSTAAKRAARSRRRAPLSRPSSKSPRRR